MNAVEHLQKARDYLMEHGWTKGDAVNEKGQACAKGATWQFDDQERMRVINGESSDISLEPCRYLRWAVIRLFPERAPSSGMCRIPQFNDHEATTFNDVMDLYDEALRLAKEDEARGRGTRGETNSDLVAEPAPSSEVAG